jgi:hypothetical protein
MEHVFHSLHGGLANRKLRQVTFNQFDAVETIVEISSKPRAEIIHHSNRVTQLNQSIDQRRPDEAGAPGHKKTRHGTSVATIFGRMLNNAVQPRAFQFLVSLHATQFVDAWPSS